MPDSLNIFGTSYPSAAGIKVYDTNNNLLTFIRPQGSQTVTTNSTYDVTALETLVVNVSGLSINNQDITITPSDEEQDYTYEEGYTGLGTVTVEAISSDYVGSNIARGSIGTILVDALENNINVNAGYYSVAIQTSMSYATNITSTASISANGNIVTNVIVGTGGYISQGTYPTVSAGVTTRSSADLTASGSSITAPAGYYASAATKTVSAGTAGTPTASKGTVSNHSVSVTPSVTNTTGWITGSTKTGTAATVSASELVSGTSAITSNGTYDVTNYASAAVSIPIVTYYTGSAAPTTGLGSNGDIYLQTS